MSSKYLILCLSHDPAIVIEGSGDWHSPEPALAAIAERAGEIRQHPNCALLVGRYSYPLVELCCPRQTAIRRPGHNVYHPNSDEWVDAGWLRLLAITTTEQRTKFNFPGCWTYETARRLRFELGIEG